MREIIAGMDIGSDTIKVIVSEIVKSKTNILAVSETESKGIKNSLVTNVDALSSAIKEAVKKVEDILGLRIKKIVINVPSVDAEFMINEGVTTITTEDKKIKGIDIVRAMQSSIYNKVPEGYEIVDIIPASFKINDITSVKNPLHMNANKLKVKSVITMVPKENILKIIEAFKKLDIEVIDATLSSIADYQTIKKEKLDNEIGAIINIGDATTIVSIFNKGVLTNTKVIKMGGQNIDNDISFIYKVTGCDARKLKETLGLAHNRMAKASNRVNVTNKLGEDVVINQYELSEIIMSRLEEILNIAKKQINYLTKKEIHYIIVTGGVSEARDFSLILESVFGHGAVLNKMQEIGIRSNKYSTVLGVIKNYDSKLKLRDKKFSCFSDEELEELSGKHKKINLSDNSVLGKLFGYFFDN